MKIAGLQKFSLIDYPNHPCAVLFTQGCNFRCPFCHNPELVLPSHFTPPIPTEDILTFLKKRQKQLPAVTISGGEPTLHADLLDFLHTIKSLGYKIKLDTNGTRPQVIAQALSQNLLDFIAMDIKSTPPTYHQLAGSQVNIDHIHHSIHLIQNSGLPHLFRTTLYPPLQDSLTQQAITVWMETLQAPHIFQTFRNSQKILINFTQS